MSIEMRRARNRQMIIFLLVCASLFGLLGRLYYWQVSQEQTGVALVSSLSSPDAVIDGVLLTNPEAASCAS